MVLVGILPEIQDMSDLQIRGLMAFGGLIPNLLLCVGIRSIISQNLPLSLLVCTKGILAIRPKEVDVTYWTEVNGDLDRLELGKRTRYSLFRFNRKPIRFYDDAFEHVEKLIDLIEQ